MLSRALNYSLRTANPAARYNANPSRLLSSAVLASTATHTASAAAASRAANHAAGSLRWGEQPSACLSTSAHTAADYFANPKGTVSAESAEVIKATLGPVVDNLDAIVSTFYDTMFENNPEVLAFFNMTNQREKTQRKSLAASLLAAVPCTLEPGKLEKLAGALDVVFHKHVALGVKPEHYAIVHDNFMAAVGKVLGDAVTPEIASAWSEAVLVVADLFIRYEVALEAATAGRTGGWRNPEAMTVVGVENAADDGSAKTITLELNNPNLAPTYEHGQYLTVVSPEPATLAPRHYTITGGSERTLSITVKHEVGDAAASIPDGALSSYLHSRKVGDVLMARPPMGVFTRPSVAHINTEVFISGGVGITPIVSFVEDAVAAGTTNVAVFNSFSSSDAAPLRNRLNAAVTNASNLVSFHEVDTGDRPGAMFTGDSIAAALHKDGVDPAALSVRYFVCGPRPFMESIISGLRTAGVPADSIDFENFGPTMSVEA